MNCERSRTRSEYDRFDKGANVDEKFKIYSPYEQCVVAFKQQRIRQLCDDGKLEEEEVAEKQEEIGDAQRQ